MSSHYPWKHTNKEKIMMVWRSGWMPMSPLRPSRVRLVVIPIITHWALLFAKKTHQKKKKIFWTTWWLDPFRGYVGNLVSFAEFSHALKKFHQKKKKEENFWTTWWLDLFRGYVGNLVSFAEFSHAYKKKKEKKKIKKKKQK